MSVSVSQETVFCGAERTALKWPVTFNYSSAETKRRHETDANFGYLHDTF
jgi:hypothetical protein